MSGITDSLRIAVGSLQLAQDALATTSNNVANAHTEGYTRKRVEQEARVVGGRGAGVREVGISREVDSFLEHQLRLQQGKLGRSETVHAYAADVQGLVFGDPSDEATGLASSVDALAHKLEAAAARPEDGARRAALVWAAQDTFDRLAGAADQVQTLRRDADRRIAALVDEVNTALRSIDDLNRDVVRSPQDATLLDQRDRLVSELSRKLDVDTYTHDDGRIAIFARSGQALLEYEPRFLDHAPASTIGRDATMNAIEIFTRDQLDPATGQPAAGESGDELVGRGVRADAADPADEIRPTVTGGELGGLLQVRDGDLPELDDQLQQLGRLLRHGLNAAHNGANDPTALPASLESGRGVAALTPTEAPTGTAYITAFETADPSNTVTAAIDLAAVRDYAANTLAPTPADWRDHFVDALAHEVDTNGGGNITASIVGDTFVIDAASSDWGLAVAEGTSAIPQADGAGNALEFGLSHFLGLNDVVETRAGGATDLAVDAGIAGDPQRLASAKLDVVDDGAGGWTATLGGVGDSRGLQDLAGALERPMAVAGRGGLPDATVGVRDYLGDVTSIRAMHAANAERTAQRDGVIAEELAFQKAGISGVNLDEEMAHLLELQQAYATSARLLTTADEMLQELLNVKR
jgi:flagellar hook-associated protein 1 FlgK